MHAWLYCSAIAPLWLGAWKVLEMSAGQKLHCLNPRDYIIGVRVAACIQVLPTTRMTEVMSQSDYVVAALPETSDTRGLIGAEAISSMQERAVFINIGRGTTVDEAALTAGQPSVLWLVICFACLLLSMQGLLSCCHTAFTEKERGEGGGGGGVGAG